ncbi:helix-turn-helix transcriptional regulator [Methanospirillum sp. J.3.6.1-F.2.7.3]|jgi:putative transcriptional regulator|uniref:Helix-turn-helix transcriptional regulator n=1 Tax=Methanospirillum purgamenti TaxID=2834276 RepID=A0A8E7AY58_9EURY|nr:MULTISPECIES: helix-turn-helix transcriptional regulator [Methanospirillum]MDX8551306.1 helix-turn-helix transcriptional regulator [Methanospirillum hungatei]NLW74884.1 helix-turn-helix transcriptional regulator [Methanomicrobiales archaeon]QVV88444.1 helix-turn-helix transcriptional regulator [Methanospirillum sp. J.3.6.1-F.2.7.3]
MKNRIKVLRAEQNMTQEELAKRIGVTRNTIISIEKDKYCPSMKVGFRIARVFDVGLEDVFSYEEEKDGPASEDT